MDGKSRETLVWLAVWGGVLLFSWLTVFRKASARNPSVVTWFAGVAVCGAILAIILAPVFASSRVARERVAVAALKKPLEGLIAAQSQEEFAFWITPGAPVDELYRRSHFRISARDLEGGGILVSRQPLSAQGGEDAQRVVATFRLRGERDTLEVQVTGEDRSGRSTISDLRLLP